MKTEKSILCGRRIKEIRQYLGLTQEEFGSLLGDWGITDKKKECTGRSPEVVASWESGRNQVPAKVLKAIMDNVLYEGEKITWAYLNGESNFMTMGNAGVTHGVFKQLDELKVIPAWHAVSIDELFSDPNTKFSSLLFDELLPLFDVTQNDIFDVMRFNQYMKNGIKALITSYIQNEKEGK